MKTWWPTIEHSSEPLEPNKPRASVLKPHRWLQQHSLRLLAIRDTPEAIAGGVAIGLFFGFTPLFGLKTISAIALAWLTRSNIIAAVVAGAAHDLVLPLMPVVFIWEYKIGFWLLSNPHHFPSPRHKVEWEGHLWRSWSTFVTIGKPLLLGSVVFAAPFAAVSFFLTRAFVRRHHRKKQSRPHPPSAEKAEGTRTAAGP